VSPDGRWVAFNEGDHTFVTAVPPGTGRDLVRLNERRGQLPVETLSRDGGLFPRFRPDGQVEFGSGATYLRWNPDSKAIDRVAITLDVPRAVPTTSFAFTNARILTLENRQVIERGTVVVRGARIACVGTCATAGVGRVIDARGKTIVPGFIDMHAHHHREYAGVTPKRAWENLIYLAYGVTTTLDNSMWSQNVFPTAEQIESGFAEGPRTFSTGDPLYRGDGERQNEIGSYEIAEQNIARLQSWGAVMVKQYPAAAARSAAVDRGHRPSARPRARAMTKARLPRFAEMGDEEIHALRGVSITIERGEIRRDHGAFRLGQVHPDEPDWLPRYPEQGHLSPQQQRSQPDERQRVGCRRGKERATDGAPPAGGQVLGLPLTKPLLMFPIVLSLPHGRQHFRYVVTTERPCPGQHLEQHHTKHPDVCALVDPLPARLRARESLAVFGYGTIRTTSPTPAEMLRLVT
jgi:hypothetical protein